MNFCPACGTPSSGERFCTSCGEDLSSLPGVQAAPAAPTYPSRPVDPAPASARGGALGDNRTLLAVAAALLVAVGVMGVLLLKGGDEPGAGTATPAAGAQDPQGAPDGDPEVDADEDPDAEEDPGTVEDPEFARCWNGDIVPLGQLCATAVTEAAMRWAFPIDWSSCTTRPDLGEAHNHWSYECFIDGAEIHIAAYRDASTRATRLSAYGAAIPKAGGLLVRQAAPPATKRWVRTYQDPTYLFYASARTFDRAVLLSIPQRTEHQLRYGLPLE